MQQAPFFAFSDLLNILFGLGSFAHSVTQIVELCASDLTATYCLDLLHVRRMERERLFDAYAVAYSSDGERLGNAAAALCDNGALVDLDPGLAALNYPVMDADSVADLDLGYFLFKLLFGKSLDYVHFGFLLILFIRTFMRSAADRLAAVFVTQPE